MSICFYLTSFTLLIPDTVFEITLCDVTKAANIVAVCSAVAPLASSELGESLMALKQGYKHWDKIC